MLSGLCVGLLISNNMPFVSRSVLLSPLPLQLSAELLAHQSPKIALPSTLRLAWPTTLAQMSGWSHDAQPGTFPKKLVGLPSCTGGSNSAVEERETEIESMPIARANHVLTFAFTFTCISFGRSDVSLSQPVPSEPFTADTVDVPPLGKPLSAETLTA